MEENKKTITVESIVNAQIDKVWKYWNEPEHITKWAFASDEWEAPSAENDLRVGGKFKTRMEAKDKSQGFDFGGVYTLVAENKSIEYDMNDGRHVKVEFTEVPEGIMIVQTFEMENQNSEDKQRTGWQAILENFKKYTESN